MVEEIEEEFDGIKRPDRQAPLDSTSFLHSTELPWNGKKKMCFNEELGERGEGFFLYSLKSKLSYILTEKQGSRQPWRAGICIYLISISG